jgi:hypothetical protein
MYRIGGATCLVIFLAAAVASACTSSRATPSAPPTPPPTPSAAPSGSPVGAALAVRGLGAVECYPPPHGCNAYLIVEARDSTDPPRYFLIDSTPEYVAPWTIGMRMTEELERLPMALPPGDYLISGSSAPNLEYMQTDRPREPPDLPSLCSAEVGVEASTTHVNATVTFAGHDCQIEVDQDSLPPSPSPSPSPSPTMTPTSTPTPTPTPEPTPRPWGSTPPPTPTASPTPPAALLT